MHWRSAAECGYVPQPHLPSFYRGLFAITSIAQQLAPESDPLLEGLQDARLLAGLAQVQEVMGLQQFGDQMDKYAAMMVGLPQRLDEMLTLASEGGDARSLARLASRLARANAAVEIFADGAERYLALQGSEARPGGYDAKAFAALPEEIRLRLLKRAIDRYGHEGPAELGKVETLLAALDRAVAGQARLKQTLAGALVSFARDRIRVEPAPIRRQGTKPTSS